MKTNRIVIGSVVLMVAGVGAYFLLKGRGGDADAGLPPKKVFPPDTLIKVRGSDPVYLIGKTGKRHHVPSPDKLTTYGFDRNSIVYVTKAELQSIPEGGPLAGLIPVLNGFI